MKHILALDGGGIRGVFSLAVLLRIEQLLREHYGRPDLVLADHFDLFAGTSTGAIIAALLCWGKSVEDILNLYIEFGSEMFTPIPWYRPYKKYLVAKYSAKPLTARLQNIFSEEVTRPDGTRTREFVTMGTPLLRKGLLVVVRNHSTGSAWPVTNNPLALYNLPSLGEQSNLNIPLWQVVRASTAAPVYFDPEEIDLGGHRYKFIDGSITPYNNPALIAALTATLPCYNMVWPSGEDNLRVVSLGTLRFSSELPQKAQRLWLGFNAAKIPAALIQGAAWQQDFLCRCMGRCLFGEPLDSEIGDMVTCHAPGQPMFSYVRYNRSYKDKALWEIISQYPQLAALDAVSAIPVLQKIGTEYAEENVLLQHLIATPGAAA